MPVVYVIPGKKLNKQSKISLDLKKRLDFCIKKYKKGDFIIVSGGNIAKTKHTEAYMMKKYLIENGNIPDFFILKENKSLSTKENIKYVKRLLKNNSNKPFKSVLNKKNSQIVFISQKKHLTRIKKIVMTIKFYDFFSVRYSTVDDH